MNKKTLLIPIALLALGLASCVPESSSSTSSSEGGDSSPDSSSLSSGSEGTASSSEEGSASSSIPTPDIRTDIDQEFLDRLSSSSLSFSGTMDVDGALSSVQGFIGKESYSFHNEDTLTTYADVSLWKDEEGNAVTMMVDTTNTLQTGDYLDENYEKVSFDEHFHNPFQGVTLEDLTHEDGLYLLSSEKAKDAAEPLNYYTDTAVSSFVLERRDDVLLVEIVSSYTDSYGDIYARISDYEIHIEGNKEIERPAPYETEEYHGPIQDAIDAWNLALSGPGDETGFVYEKTMTPLDDDTMGIATSRSTITYDATLWDNDGGITSEYDHGYATFDDGNMYEFEIVDGEVVVGDQISFYDAYMPWPGMVAAELFVPTEEENVYAYRDDASVLDAVCSFLEDGEVAGYLYYYGGVSDLTITLGEDGNVTNFSYTSLMMNYSGGFYHERTSVDIKDMDEATIPYEFVLPEVEIPAGMLGEWSGKDLYTQEPYTMTVTEDSILVNGEEATLSGVSEDKWGNLDGTLTFGGNSYDFTYNPATSSLEAQITFGDDYGYVYVVLTPYVPLGIPEEVLGTWIGGEYTVVVSEDGVTLNGENVETSEWTESLKGYKATFTHDGLELTLSYSIKDDALTLSTDDMFVYVELEREGAETPALDPKYVGTWKGTDDAGTEHVLVINEDGSATLDGNAFDEPLEFKESLFMTTAEGTVEGVLYTMNYMDASDGAYIRLFDDDYLIDVELYKEEATLPSIDPKYVGTWEGTDEWTDIHYTLVINEDGTATLNGEAFDEPLNFVPGMVNDEAEATLNGVTYTFTYSELLDNVQIHVVDENYDVDVVLTLQEDGGDDPVTSDVFPESMLGEWKTSDESHTLVVNADGTVTLDGTVSGVVVPTGHTDEWTVTIGGEEYSLSYYGSYGTENIYLGSGSDYFLFYR